MSDEERLLLVGHMERMIRDFRIVVTGGADIEGGFGPLPKSSDMKARVSNLERSLNQFHLVGHGVDVSGNLDNGLVVS